ncbi:MAG: AAA-like domain-containing protein [Cyanobacteria bacterium P01_A01_bin.123]
MSDQLAQLTLTNSFYLSNAMDVYEALHLVDQLVYANTDKHLNDLERQVFVGSWNNLTYEKIYPHNPEYVEKTVGYRLWQKLSDTLGEKVTKKRVKGALERLLKRQKHIFISYRGHPPDCDLADGLSGAMQLAGHVSFASNLDAIASLPSTGEQQQPDGADCTAIDLALKHCDCFVLLLSAQTAVSEMAVEQLQRLRQGRHEDDTDDPLLVVILVDCPQDLLLSHDLRHYLTDALVWRWQLGQAIQPLVHEIQQQLGIPLGTVYPPPVTLETLQFGPEVPAPTAPTDAAQPAALPFEANRPETCPEPISSPAYPLPAAEPEIPRGQVRLASAFYVDRVPYEAQCYEAIGRPGALIRLKAPRQMGKTSLMARILHQAREKGYQAIPISFQHADRAVFENLGSLLQWFCTKVARKLHLPPRLDEYWVDTYGSKDNCTTYFEDYLLPEIDSPLVLGLDEVDAVFQYPQIADDFFGLLRAWYEEASYGSDDSELWEKLRLVVVHSTEVYLPLDVNQSPFNVGLPIELLAFTASQVTDLAHRHGLDWTPQQVETLTTLVGGHPYLIRLALYSVVQNQITLSDLCQTAPTEAGIYGDHLRRHLWFLEQHPDLAQAYSAVLQALGPLSLDSECTFKLQSLGLVRLQGNGVVPSFNLYRHYFRDRLQAHPPKTSDPPLAASCL